jgi:hypothetical protein
MPAGANRPLAGITVLDFGQAPPDSEKSPPSLEARLSWPGDE